MKQTLEKLALESLAKAEWPIKCDANDLVNVTLILNHISMSLAYPHLKSLGMTLEQMSVLAEEYGSNIRQSIQLFTGVDLHDAVKGESWPEVVTRDK